MALRTGSIQIKLNIRQRILDLYEFGPKEKALVEKKAQEEIVKKYTKPGEEKETNKGYKDLLISLRKSLDDLTQQEECINDIREGMCEILKREGIKV